MSFITGAGSLSRIFGPLCASSLYTRYGTTVIMFVTLILMLIPMICLAFLKKRLSVENINNKNVEMNNLAEENGLKSLRKDDDS